MDLGAEFLEKQVEIRRAVDGVPGHDGNDGHAGPGWHVPSVIVDAAQCGLEGGIPADRRAAVEVVHLRRAVQAETELEVVLAAELRVSVGQQRAILDWPYREGLRLDEAMHPLTILATGLYDQPMPNQNGAPIRLVVPWKYGFKSIKSIVRINLLEQEPVNTWKQLQASEYGFYANVNPQVDHPRWSQATERVIGAGLFGGRKETLMFNGYGDQVASLYAGMDLSVNY